MNPRARRVLLAAVSVVALLFVGRWSAEFLAERWWAGTISPAAQAAVVRWWLLGLLLNVVTIAVASCWFVLQALAITRTIASAHIPRRIGDLEVREAVPMRLLFWGAVIMGVVLGGIAGAGSDSWRGALALAWEGVHWGTTDPLLNADLGFYIAILPAWTILHDFLLTLLIVGVAFTVTLYIVIGAIRRDGKTLVWNMLAQRHVGTLLALLALVIGAAFMLAPAQLAASEQLGGSLTAAHERITILRWFIVVAGITGAGSVAWATGRRALYLGAGWSALALAMLASAVVLPGRPAPLDEQNAIAELQLKFSNLAWGINELPATMPHDSAPPVTALWDERLLRRAEGVLGLHLLAATPTTVTDPSGHPAATWLLASIDTSGRRIETRGIIEGITTADGTPAVDPALTHRVSRPRTWPDGPEWHEVPDAGVTIRNSVSKLMVAWGRQAGGMLSIAGAISIDWHIDPAERASAIMPMIQWLPADILLSNDRPVWVTQGVIPTASFPLSYRLASAGGEIAGLLPGYLAIIDVATGATTFYRDPASGPLAAAWSAFVPGLVQPADSLPAALRDQLPYAPSWADVQLEIIDRSHAQLMRSRTAELSSSPVVTWLTPAQPAVQEVMIGNQLLSAVRTHGLPGWYIATDSGQGTGTREELHARFRDIPVLVHLQDSINALGDTATLGALRWWKGSGNSVAWQPLVALDRQVGPRLLGVANEQQHVAALNRSVTSLWRGGSPAGVGRIDSLAQDASTIGQARHWLALADSALRRGDLTAFGRYFESLQRVLGTRKPQ